MTESSQRRWFNHYIDALNRDDLDGIAACYAPDLHITDGQTDHRSADAAMDFHRRSKGLVTRTLEVLAYVDRPGRIAAEIGSILQAHEDVPDHPAGPLTRGERRTGVSFVIFDMADGRFTRIRSAPYKAAP
ncbi:nuclear transport factor 2 family protein [Niveispirillum sp. KHB5.9]|uniref:nuclear transport factor 2 family protein n=1 Tax=Niveispirillum sp. KHB5.9 TaxID=3400269 RepID=UPI003A881C5D